MFKLRKYSLLTFLLVVLILVSSCSNGSDEKVSLEGKDVSGTYTGYSWKGESKGVSLEEAGQKIETTLTIDEAGVITDAKMLFLKQNSEGEWYTRQDTAADITINYDVVPSMATLPSDEKEYAHGDYMFDVDTADMMAFYAAGVNSDGTVAFTIVEPYTRYQFEYKLDKDFDFSMPMGEMTIGNGLAVPAVRTSSSGNIKPESWEEYTDYSALDFYEDPYVLTREGVFEGLGHDSSIKEYLEAAGVVFENNEAVEMPVTYGFTGVGGWEGNYKAIEEHLIGKNVAEITSLIDWENPRYKKGINEDNFFGLDVVSGATKTVQDSADTISGATVRMSRESTSYQRALVEAGIIEEKDVVKGRF